MHVRPEAGARGLVPDEVALQAAEGHAGARYADGRQGWLTGAELEDYHAALRSQGIPIGKPGTGGTLKLSRAASALALPEADSDVYDNESGGGVSIIGSNPADISAVGDEVTGEAGDVVEATVGVANRGPATIDWKGAFLAVVTVTLPEGTSVVAVPEGCREQDGVHKCPPVSLLRAGEQETFTFKLRIGSVGSPGADKVEKPCGCPHERTYSDPSNNTARLVVSSPDPGGGGGGGGLTVTGPGGFILAGFLLTTGGVVAFVIARRRTRFVA